MKLAPSILGSRPYIRALERSGGSNPPRLSRLAGLAAPPSRVVRHASDIQAAFKECQAAAELFPAGSNERQVAGEMIAKLEGASMASWNPDDMQLLDSCLVDEGSEACVAFSNAMTALRELHEGSPGNA